MYVYKITNKINGKVYIGKTTRSILERWEEHCKPSNSARSALACAIQKHNPENFEIEELAKASSEDELNLLEYEFIKQLSSMSPIGYNLKEGGKGGRHTDGTKKKIGEASKGHQCSDQQKQQLSQKLKGRAPNNRKPVIGMNPTTDEIIKLPHSYADPRFCSVQINLCCNGKRPHHKGFIWKFDEDSMV